MMGNLKKGSRVGIVACSNGLEVHKEAQLKQLADTLARLGVTPVFGEHLYAGGADPDKGRDGVRSTSGRGRAEELTAFLSDRNMDAVFDVSGGDVAVEVLPYLDFDAVAGSPATFWGYSDLTVILNAIYAKTGRTTCLYQVRNLVRSCAKRQAGRFADLLEGGSDLFDISWEFIRGSRMEGVVVGGNARCFLKLAGSHYMPDLTDKILFLEGMSGGVPQLISIFNQLGIMGAYGRVGGILLGTFTEMDSEGCGPTAAELLAETAPPWLPIARTREIGHGADAKCLRIGHFYSIG